MHRAAVRAAAAILGTVLAVGSGGWAPTGGKPTTKIELTARSRTGAVLSARQFRALQRNGHGTSGDDDALVDPVSLQVLAANPLVVGPGNRISLDPHGVAATLAMAWPGALGYRQLLLDLPSRGGRYAFEVLVAQQTVSDVDAALAARPTYTPSAVVAGQIGVVRSLASGLGLPLPPAARAVMAWQVTDAAEVALAGVLDESGRAMALARLVDPPRWAVTLDVLPTDPAALASVRALSPGTNGWVRVILDAGVDLAAYAEVVAAAHAQGLRVLVLLADSSEVASLTMDAWQQRVIGAVAALAGVDEWEVANEVNGAWTGVDALAKARWAAAYVRATTTARTLLTVFWQLGEDSAASSLFTWVHQQLDPALLATIDDIGLSLWPEASPLGTSIDRVLRTLHDAVPSSRLLVSELGYWNDDTAKQWTWGDPTDPTGAGRRAVASFYGAAVLGLPWSDGGGFWWYYLEDALPPNALWSVLASVARIGVS